MLNYNNLVLYDGKIHRHAIKLAVEKALLKIGSNELEKVQSLLASKYDYDIEDCLDHPDVLKEILSKTYGQRYDEIFKSILDTLHSILIVSTIGDFIEELRC